MQATKKGKEKTPEIGKLSVGYIKKDTNLAEMLCFFPFYFCATLGVVEYSGVRLIFGFPDLPSQSPPFGSQYLLHMQ